MLSDSLITTAHVGSCPESVDRKRGMAHRLAGREGRVERAGDVLGEQCPVLDLADGHPEGEMCKEVPGVVLSRLPVALDEWVRGFATAIAAHARSDARARAAL
ncbi:hypothetical protein ACWGQ5_41265 [Streptomyces sp. NPDC055722]